MTRLLIPLSASMIAVLGATLSGCDRGRDREPEVVADTAGAAETPEHTTELLSPIRTTGLVLVEYGQAVAQRAAREDVRQYAQVVATDHRALIAALDSAARLRGATLSETPAARDLAHTARMAHAGLDTMEPAQVDLAYVRAEVETHRQLLDRLDQELIPGATSNELRNLLQEIRATVDAHLMRGRQLLGDLLGQPVEAPPAGATQTAPRPPPADTAPRPTGPPPPEPPPGGPPPEGPPPS